MKQRSNTSSLPGTRAVVRAITVLKTMGRSPGAHGISELGTATGLSKATVFRLLGALETEGMVARDTSSGNYMLGPELISLGNLALSTTDLRSIAHDELVALSALTGETATLEVLVGADVIILDEVKGRFLVGSTPEIGHRWAAHATSTGKLLMALSPEGAAPARLARLASADHRVAGITRARAPAHSQARLRDRRRRARARTRGTGRADKKSHRSRGGRPQHQCSRRATHAGSAPQHAAGTLPRGEQDFAAAWSRT